MIIKKLLIQLIDSIRIILGPRWVCIYHVSCRKYAKTLLQQKPWYIAVLLIFLRILSCNPLTAIFFRIRNRFNSSNTNSR